MYNFTTQCTPGRENVVADLLARAMPNSVPDTTQDPSEPQLILMLQVSISLLELQAASAQDPMFTQLCTFIQEDRLRAPENLVPYHHVRGELSCWNNVCIAKGSCAVSLREQL